MYNERKNLVSNLKIFLSIIFILLLIGIIFIYSASSVFAMEKFGTATYFVKKQLFGVLLGLLAMFVISILPINLIKKFVPFIFFCALILTALTLVPSLAQQIHGSRRWLSIAGLTFQPSEILKYALIVYVAFLLDKKSNQKLSFFNSYFPLLLVLGISAGILLKQPDFGLAAALFITVFILLFIAKFRTKYLFLTLLFAIPTAFALIFFKKYRLKRILTFLNPWDDPQGAGFQIIQSLIAIGSGGFTGIGISNSKQKFFYLPMQHTDFIFSIIAEETGLLGSSILILLFILFLFFGLKIAWKFKDNFYLFSTLGFVILISLQALINLSVTVGIFPTKGIGLPFVSYGNSSLICSLSMVGLIINFVRNYRN